SRRCWKTASPCWPRKSTRTRPAACRRHFRAGATTRLHGLFAWRGKQNPGNARRTPHSPPAAVGSWRGSPPAPPLFPGAEEVRERLDWMGVRVVMIQDVGVAGPHRLPARLAEFEHADAVVVVAGMEGALPSVVGGYVSCPVIGVPTSVGYGANFGGLSALLSMLNSCANNVAVVNIDAGFKGGFLAGLIANSSKPSA